MTLSTTFLRSPRVLFVLLILTSVFGGWCVFNLQAVSILSLLQEAGLRYLPLLMMSQSVFSWLLLRAWGNAALVSAQRFFVTALIVGLITSLIAHHPDPNVLVSPEHKIILYSIIFILSQLTVSAIRMGIHVTFSKQISVLLNPQLSVHLAIAEEAGFLVGILLLIAFPSSRSWGTIALSSVPYLLSFLVVALLWLRGRLGLKVATPAERVPLLRRMVLRTKQNIFTSAAPARSSQTHSRLRKAPYLKNLILLFTVVATLKALSWFGLAYGLDIAMREGNPLLSLFSKLSLLQSTLTLTILLASMKFARRIPTWSVGFQVLLGSQGGFFAVLAVFPMWFNLLGNEVARKVIEHGFLGRSLQLLTSSLPDEERLEMRHLMEQWSTTSGVALAGLGAFFVIFAGLPIQALFGASVLLCLFGLRLRKKLFSTLSDFHLAHLGRSNLNGVIQACQVLGNPESGQHYAALVGMLERKPRPAVTKSALHSLGRMQNPKAIVVIQAFIESTREDVQLAAVNALHNYSGHEINLRLLKLLRDLVRSDMAIRNSVVRLLTQRLGRLAIPYLLELLENPPSERVAANTVEILGEIAVSLKDDELKSYLSRFLRAETPRRMQANAIVALYHERAYMADAQECFDRLMTSQDEKSLASFAYIAGRLGLHGHEAVIWEMSERLNHVNSTFLIALLRLNDPEAPGILASWIVGDDEKRGIEGLVRLSAVPLRKRSKVLFELMEKYPDKLDLVLQRMRASQRDFEADRTLIRDEARRLGIVLGEDTIDMPASLLAVQGLAPVAPIKIPA